MKWPPDVAPNATWSDIVALQLHAWIMRGRIDVDAFLRDTDRLRALEHPPNAALVDTATWRIERIGAQWKGHHSVRATAVLNIFRLAQARARAAGHPLPRIRFVLIVSDGHGATTAGFNASKCTCKTEASCCQPSVDAAVSYAPAAPSFATLFCRHSYDVSVPTIIDDLLDTSSTESIDASVRKWLSLGEAHPWQARRRQAFFVGDEKAYRPAVLRHGAASPAVLATHRAVSTDATRRLPFAEHAKYKAVIYAHGFHFNSVRMRRLALLGGAVLAPADGPCKEWWQLLAHPWRHYAPTTPTFTDLVDVATRLLDPARDDQAHAMAAELRALGLRSFRAAGLLDYVSALWREYARLSRPAAAPQDASTPPAVSSSLEEADAATAPARAGGRSRGPSRAADGWACAKWPTAMSGGLSDRERCLLGNRLGSAFEWAHNRQRGTSEALCRGACTCCRRSATIAANAKRNAAAARVTLASRLPAEPHGLQG